MELFKLQTNLAADAGTEQYEIKVKLGEKCVTCVISDAHGNVEVDVKNMKLRPSIMRVVSRSHNVAKINQPQWPNYSMDRI